MASAPCLNTFTFRSKEFLILVNKLGHHESYSFSLELEVVIAQALE